MRVRNLLRLKFHKNKEEKMTVDKFRQQIFRRLTRDRFRETDVVLWRKLKPNCLRDCLREGRRKLVHARGSQKILGIVCSRYRRRWK